MLPVVVIAGRPNVGKSTLFNKLAGRRHALVADTPGVTRDRKDATAMLRGREVRLVDTAGLEESAPETLYGRMRASSEAAVHLADLVLFVIDARTGVTPADEHFADWLRRQGRPILLVVNKAEGRACVIAMTKWDAVTDRDFARKAVSDRLEASLAQMKGIPVVTLSGITGQGVEKLLPAIRRAHDVWNRRVATGELNRWFEAALERHQPPLVDGRRLKMRYITQAKARPPTFIVFGTRAEQTPDDYQRYLVNSLRDTFELPGTPVRLLFRGSKNPYAEGSER